MGVFAPCMMPPYHLNDTGGFRSLYHLDATSTLRVRVTLFFLCSTLAPRLGMFCVAHKKAGGSVLRSCMDALMSAEAAPEVLENVYSIVHAQLELAKALSIVLHQASIHACSKWPRS